MAPYDNDNAFIVTERLVPTSPPSEDRISAGPGDSVTFTWKPLGKGAVILEFAGTIYTLKDEGSFTLPLDKVALNSPIDSVPATLSRVTMSDVDAAGNTFRVQTRSDQVWFVDYVDLGNKYTGLIDGETLADGCSKAQGLTAVGAGKYVGALTSYANDVELPAYNPATGLPTSGRDGFVKVELEAGQTLQASYQQDEANASFYLLNASCDTETPLTGSDEDPNRPSTVESLSYKATTNETVYLALDAYVRSDTFAPILNSGDLFILDILIKGNAD